PAGSTAGFVTVPTANLFTADPTLTNPANVVGNAGIQLTGGSFATFGLGALTATTGSTLNVLGLPGKKVTFAGTTVTGLGDVTFNTTADVVPGQITAAATVNVMKTGAGQLVLDNTAAGGSANSFAPGSSIYVNGGRLV